MTLREMLTNCSISSEQLNQAEKLAFNAALGTSRVASVGISGLNEELIKECRAYSDMAKVLLMLPDAVLDTEIAPEQQKCFAEMLVATQLFKASLPKPATK